jgi:prepilin-type processing-associated H-X9-DG protein/prepilin-type N-terminal cleavage/methylation domain-containing protein
MRHPQRRSAFTLVELLVVVAIIAVLIALLLPVISRARQEAEQAKCAANLQQLFKILLISMNEHGGYLPLAGNIEPGTGALEPDTPETLGDPTMERYCYYDNGGGLFVVTALPAAIAKYITTSPVYTSNQPITNASPVVRDDSWQDVDADIQTQGPLQNLFLCPADQNTIDRTYAPPTWIKNYGSATFLNGWSSYGVNAEIFAWTDNGVGSTTGHSRLRGKIAGVPHPADTMLMCDSYQYIEMWVLGPQLSLGDAYLGTGVTVGSGVFDLLRHRGSMNILFVDGHVESQPILANNATLASGAPGSPGNTPSGALMHISMDKDFP